MSLNINHSRGAVRRSKVTRWHRRRDRGGMGVLCAVMIPVLVGFGALAVDQGNYTHRSQLLRQTVQSAALAAADKLSTYYSTGSTSAVVTAAQTFATSNMPSSQYGTVVPSSNVVTGTWNASTNTFTSGGSTPNAVQVTGLNTTANGNPVSMFFGSFFGKSSADITSTSVASNVGTVSGSGGSGTGRSFNAIVINDMSQSFTGEISDQISADQAILNCVQGQTGSTSYFGVTFFNGAATTYQPLVQPGTSAVVLAALQTKINLIVACSILDLEDLSCSTGSNIASGIYSAIQQFSGSTFAGQSKNIIIITDGAPDVHSGFNYTTADGQTCGRNCTTAEMEAGAQAQAALARAAGISISTIYYTGDDSNLTDQANNKTFLASLVTGSGIALVAPTAAQIDSSFYGVCSTIPSSVKTSS